MYFALVFLLLSILIIEALSESVVILILLLFLCFFDLLNLFKLVFENKRFTLYSFLFVLLDVFALLNLDLFAYFVAKARCAGASEFWDGLVEYLVDDVLVWLLFTLNIMSINVINLLILNIISKSKLRLI